MRIKGMTKPMKMPVILLILRAGKNSFSGASIDMLELALKETRKKALISVTTKRESISETKKERLTFTLKITLMADSMDEKS
jgi:hypothetical protein